MGMNSVTLISNWQLTQVDKTLILECPYAPIPSASSLGVGFGYLHTFSQDIWSTRGADVYQSVWPHLTNSLRLKNHIKLSLHTSTGCTLRAFTLRRHRSSQTSCGRSSLWVDDNPGCRSKNGQRLCSDGSSRKKRGHYFRSFTYKYTYIPNVGNIASYLLQKLFFHHTPPQRNQFPTGLNWRTAPKHHRKFKWFFVRRPGLGIWIWTSILRKTMLFALWIHVFVFL